MVAVVSSPESRAPNPGLGRAVLLGVLTGVIYFAGTLYWITRVMVVYGGLPGWAAVPINIALIAYLALFPAAFAVCLRRAVRSAGAGIALALAPAIWVATELLRTYVLTGFPWVLLGYSQTTVLPIAQFASIFGVYGVSALVAAVSAAAAYVVVGPPEGGPHAGNGQTWRPALAGLAPIGAVLLTVLAIAAWGSRRVAESALTHEGDPIRVGLVQGNVDQGQKWNVASAAEIFNTYLDMTRQAIGRGADLVLWPESSTPFMYEENPIDADRIRTLARQAHVSILVGSDQIVREQTPKYYNSAFLVRDDGTTAGVYRKMHLVPFGEYVPLQRLLFFAAPLTDQVGTFSAGMNPDLLPVAGHLMSTAICYEIVYPDLVRQFVRRGSELLSTITNDAWFGTTSAPYQHFEQASMRAVEEGRYLVRAANTGVSGIVDPYGRVLARTDIYQPAVVVGDVRFLRTETIYARIGDAFAYAALLLTAAVVLLPRRKIGSGL